MNTEEKQVKKWVWIPCNNKVYKAGYVISEDNNTVKVQSDVCEEVNIANVHKINPVKFDMVEDLAALSYLNEPSVLYNLEKRYDAKEIYTYSGLFLIALNPYHSLNIYDDDIKKLVMKGKIREGKPHIYEIANEAYQSMILSGRNQSILITGESGAGKTENTKKVIEFLTYAVTGSTDGRGLFNIKQALISTNPILEAFGNAKTVKNDNSSRFGKFIQIKFKDRKICGAKIEKYLLEKSRVIGLSRNDRNFHIFYYLLKGLNENEKQILELTGNPDDYNCLKNTQHVIKDVNDCEEFLKLNKAFSEFGIVDPMSFYRVVAIVMHLSNFEFVEKEDGKEGCALKRKEPLEAVCRLLGVSEGDLINAILHSMIKAGKEAVGQHRNAEQAHAVVEGLMKMLYEVLFDTLIEIINKKLDSNFDSYIGILDIAGFEIFENNSFEQFCINHTNEKLQQYFNQHMFILEQENYRVEEIKWDFINFGFDLEPTISLIESSYPIGILSYLDEECVMPCANDDTLLEKLKKIDGVEAVSFKNRFSIKHYAGKVEYEVKNWVIKNKDTESEKLFNIIKDALKLVLNTPFCERRKNESVIVKKGVFKTVGQSHKESLNWLIRRLKETQPHFVRCILPNTEKKPDEFNRKIVLDQLRCNGVLEGIRISRLGYPSRLTFTDFNNRYSILVSDDEAAWSDASTATGGVIARDETARLVKLLKIAESQYRVGKTMVFFRQGVLGELEDLRDEKIYSISVCLKNLIRSKMEEKRANLDNERLAAVTKIQKNSRLCLELLYSKWWSLFLKIQPLLDVKKSENEKKLLEEDMERTAVELQKHKKDLDEKTQSITELEVLVANLKNDIKKKEAEKYEAMEVVARLRKENTRMPKLENEHGESLRAIKELNEELEMVRGCERNHFCKQQELENVIEQQRSTLKQKDAEIEYFTKKDFDNVLRIKTKENEEMKGKIAEYEQAMKEKSKLAARNELLLEERSSRLSKLQEELAGRISQLEACEKLNNELIFQKEELRMESDKMVAKLRGELADLQLANDNMINLLLQYECMEESYINKVNNLEQELKYQRERNNKLQKLFEDLKAMKSSAGVEKNELKEETNSKTAEENVKLVAKLRNKLKTYEKLVEDLRKEKDALYNENLNLTQNRLDEIFTNENEFNKIKVALQNDVRRLELENRKLRNEMATLSQNVSDCSEENGYEKLVMVVEEERRQRLDLTRKLVDLENTNMKLVNELKASQDMNDLVSIDSTSVSKTIVKLEREIEKVRKTLKKVSEVFFMKLLGLVEAKEKDFCELNEQWIGEREKLLAAESELVGLRKKLLDKEEQIDAQSSELLQCKNENESMAVAQKANLATIKELRNHIGKLEQRYSERETEITAIRSKYDAAVCQYLAAVQEYENKREELKNKIYNFDWSKFNTEIDKIRREYKLKINELSNSLSQAVEKNEDLEVDNYKKITEINDLKNFIDKNMRYSSSIQTNKLEDDLICERLISTFVVDKDALKAAEWKNIVESKCQKCASKNIILEDSNSRDFILEKNQEIDIINLKLKQAERVISDNNKIIETMKLCLSAIHKK